MVVAQSIGDWAEKQKVPSSSPNMDKTRKVLRYQVDMQLLRYH